MSGTFVVRRVESFVGKQIIIWLSEEQGGATGPQGDGGPQWCVRVTADDAPRVMRELADAYVSVMQALALDLAAGGCRTCSNTRKVSTDASGKQRAYVGLMDGEAWQPCPVCVPRAEKRLRSIAHFSPKGT